MASLRCTQRLLKALRTRPDEALPQPSNRLGDWYANVLNAGPNRLVIVTSERTLLTVIVPIRDAPRLGERIREAVHDMLFRLGIPPDLAADEVRGMDRMALGKTANRSVLSSMNELTFLAKHYFADEPGPVNLAGAQRYLAGTPMGALEHHFPCDEVCLAFGLSRRSHNLLNRVDAVLQNRPT
jgi:hypothetical protein